MKFARIAVLAGLGAVALMGGAAATALNHGARAVAAESAAAQPLRVDNFMLWMRG